MNFQNLLAVTIDFKTSHLIFPAIVASVLGLLLLGIVITRWHSISGGDLQLRWPGGADKTRLFGTLLLTITYFLAMEHIGNRFPNQGLGFLIASIPFLFLVSMLYMHARTTRKTCIAAINATLSPLAVWYILANLFNISLP